MTTQTKTKNLDRVLLGRRLLKLGFRVWFLYMFRLVNGTEFIEEKLHRRLFRRIQRIIDGKDTRLNINLCPRSGKCFGKGTLVRMYDGSVRPIETIRAGEKVMGRDSTPRYVLGLGRGREMMYRITNADGSSFVCNESHLLVLHNTVNSRCLRLGKTKRSYAGVENIITVRDYLRATQSYKKRNKMIKAPVEYPKRKLPLDPYMLGLWLGDGHTDAAAITNPDKEIVQYIEQWAADNGNKIKTIHQDKTDCKTYYLSGDSGKPLRIILRNIGVLGFKHIPDKYLLADSESRKRLLAGLIDTDGYSAGGKGSVVICLKSYLLISQIVDLARSLGFYASQQIKYNKKYGKKYYCAYISGDIDSLPIQLARKRTGKSTSKISPLLQSFTIEPIGVDNYYGICVDGDEEFLLADYTVVHNTTINQWLCVYALTINPRSQIIYTSFNQDLLSQISQAITGIMTHPAYIAMYSNGADITETIEDVDPIDDFWREYLLNTTGKAKFSSRKIITAQGGIILFNSIGSAITGFGAGVRNAKGFSGMLCIDDGDKPTEVRSEKIRSKTHTYFVETLLTRLNNSDTPITNTQQRLHQDDLSGFLEENYKFDTFKFPLLDEDGKCNLPRQYTDRRIKELQVDAYTFSAQYQQEPIMLGGGVFKLSWFRFYQDINDQSYRRIFITADTACKTKEWNDFTAIGVWGITRSNKLRLLDFVHGRFEIPELLAVFDTLWNKWKQGIGTCRCTAIYIEDKASGTQVIQTLRRNGGLPIMPLIPEKDKLTRALDALPQIAAGNVELPESENHPLSKEILIDVLAFSADGTHRFDDSVDCMLYAIDAAYNQRGYF